MNKDNWRLYPKKMMEARAKTYAVRILFPDILAGVYDKDEFEMVNVTPKEENKKAEEVPVEVEKVVEKKEIQNQRGLDFSIEDVNASYIQNGIIHHNSGKSNMIYLTIRYLLTQKSDKKILLVVPIISLVEQMYNDFKSYGWKDLEKYVEKLLCTALFSKNLNLTWKRPNFFFPGSRQQCLLFFVFLFLPISASEVSKQFLQ
jgi:hypothetical protein